MFRNLAIVFVIQLLAMSVSAQNLVWNPGFEDVDKKVKGKGEILLADPWVPGTKEFPDLFTPKTKDPEYRSPVNKYGEQKAHSGENYAGILVYSPKGKEARSYLTTKLKYPMIKGDYCVRFWVSFADLSKYASANLGLYISKDSIGSETDERLDYQPQIIHSLNRVFEKQWDWEPICRIYRAEGGEKYITIGNFGDMLSTPNKPVKRPPGFTQAQIRNGYYYIDDISVEIGGTPQNCKCEKGNFAFADMNKQEESFASNDKDAPKPTFIGSDGTVVGEKKVEKKAKETVIVSFDPGKNVISAADGKKLDEVAEYLKGNPTSSVEIISHIDKMEAKLSGVSAKRLSAVNKYLVTKGVKQDRIKKTDAGADSPLDTSGTKENRGKNMVVEVKYN